MLDTTENRFIITTEEGRMVACYPDRDSAELDAQHLGEGSSGKTFNIYELSHTLRIGDGFLQNIYAVRDSFPKEKEVSDSADEEKPSEESPEEKNEEGKKEDIKE